MALTRQQSVFTYSSSSNGVLYLFDIVVDSQSQVSVRNIRGPQGAITGTQAVPQSVMDDIREAMNLVVLLVSEDEAVGGNATFTGETTQPVAIAAGLLNDTDYRVVYTTSDGTVLTTENQTLTGFDVVAATPYGSVGEPKVVAYSVLVKTVSTSSYSGTLTFAVADGGQKSVTFPTAMTTTSYRVILEPAGFFSAYTLTRTRTGFTVQIGHTLSGAETVDVGYDVFV